MPKQFVATRVTKIERFYYRTYTVCHIHLLCVFYTLTYTFLSIIPMESISQRSDEEPRSAYNEDERSMKQRREIEKCKLRQKWLHMQELERKHERLKQNMIEAYERKRAETLKSKLGSLHHSRSRSRSKSLSRYHHREKIMSSVSKSDTASKKLGESTSGTISLFRGPEDTQLAHINSIRLPKIKVTFSNGFSPKSSATVIHRNITNPEEVVVPRRYGEGCKPLFDKEEIKKAGNVSETEKRKVLDVNKQATPINKLITSKRRSLSLSPVRNHNHHSENYTHHPIYTPPSQNRYRNEELKLDNARYSDRKSDRRGSVERQREYKERDVRRYDNRSHSRERESRTSHSISFTEGKFYPNRHRDRSRERSRDRRDRDRHDRDADRHRDREKNRDRDRDRNWDRHTDRHRDRERNRDRDRDRDRERRDVATHYIEPVPVPIYYGNLPPRPIVISPIGPLRPVPSMGRGRHPPIMAPVRPFPPRLVPPELYRMGVSAPNPRYGPMFQ